MANPLLSIARRARHVLIPGQGEVDEFLRRQREMIPDTGGGQNRMITPDEAAAQRGRQSLSDSTGWAGSNLATQLDNEQQQRPLSQSPSRLPPPISEEVTAPPLPNPLTRTPLGDAPPPPQLIDRDQSATRTRYANPLQYGDSGRPSLRADNYGSDPLTNEMAERDALQQWQPHERRSLGGIGKGALYAALPALSRGDVFGAAGAAAVGATGTAVSPNFGGKLQRNYLLNQSNANVNQGLDQAQQQATVANQQVGPILRQQQIAQGEERLRQSQDRITQQVALAQKRNLATQYNGLKEFDPDDPKNADATAAYTRAFGFRPPRKVTGSLLQFVEGTDAQGNATFTVIDKGNATAQQVTGTGLPAKTEGQLGRESTAKQGDLNRDNRLKIIRMVIDGLNKRQDKQIAADIAKLGNSDEIFTAASEAWTSAQAKRKEAEGIKAKEGYQLSTADSQRRQQLMREAQELEGATVRMQQEGRKASSAGRSGSVAATSAVKPTLDGALRAFRARAKREPTAEEITNIKRHYGFQ